MFLKLLTVMGPMVEVEVEVAGLTRAMVSLLARVTASRATEATTRAPTAAPAPTTREDMAAMVSPSQVEEDTVTVQNHSFPVTHWCIIRVL